MRLLRLVRFAAVAGLAALAAMMPDVALGHADLESSTPASGATLATAPTEVELIFGGELVPDGSGFTVTDADGRTVGTGELDLAVAERNELRGPIMISRPGTFTVTWTSVAADGHRESGAFTFAYGSEVPDTAFAAPAAWAVPALGSLLVLAAAAVVARRAGRSVPVKHPRALAALLVLAIPIIGGCVGDAAECEALPTRIELALAADRLVPSDPAVCRDREVTLVVTPEVDGILHVHGYDDQLPATEVTAGEIIGLSFTATRSGQFPIELHADDNAQGSSVGILTVHEP